MTCSTTAARDSTIEQQQETWLGELWNTVCGISTHTSVTAIDGTTDKRKPEYSDKIPSQCHFVHHKSHMHWPGIEPPPLLWEASDWPPVPKHGRNFNWKVQPKLLVYRIQGTRRNGDEMCYTGLFWGQSVGKSKVCWNCGTGTFCNWWQLFFCPSEVSISTFIGVWHWT